MRAGLGGTAVTLGVVAALALMAWNTISPPRAELPAEDAALIAQSDLADRVNAACTKARYRQTDWKNPGDEFDPVPAGLLRVTCTEQTPGADGLYDSYTVFIPYVSSQ